MEKNVRNFSLDALQSLKKTRNSYFYVTPKIRCFMSLHYISKSSPTQLFFFTEHPCRSATSIKLQSNFIEVAFWHGCSPVNLLPIFRTPFLKNTSEGLLLYIQESMFYDFNAISIFKDKFLRMSHE